MPNNREPCLPPAHTLRHAKLWWIEENLIQVGCANTPSIDIWQWNPVRQAWNKPGTIASIDQRDRTPEEFAGYKILGEAIPPGPHTESELAEAIRLLNAFCQKHVGGSTGYYNQAKRLIAQHPGFL